ncbi:MAG: RDD family protein [Acidobacteria bacterium]|nr:RDD family protein [Acidobacteriota bacterium]
MTTRHVSDAGLRVSHELLGAELASPARRLAAVAIDGAILLIPSLLIAILVAWATLAVRQPAALHALTGLIGGRLTTPEQQRAAMRDLIPLMVDYHMPGTPAEVAVAYHQGDLDRAVEALRGRDIMVVLNVEGQPVGGSDKRIRIELGRLMPPAVRLASLYGLAALYFSWFTSRRSGATLGKRWLGIRVERIDEGRLGFVMSFERFVGYAQVPASFFTALIDFWRDLNRRLPHDRLAGTLVVRTGSDEPDLPAA